MSESKTHPSGENVVFPVLSIDAWGNPEDGYEWNSWHRVGLIEVDLDKPEQNLIQRMVEEGFIKPEAFDWVEVEDDGYNVVFMDKKTREPVYAIEYGPLV
jgi:hypothetical protein